MIVQIDTKEKKITVLRWLVQGYIDTQDIEEFATPQRGVPIKKWLEWEANNGDTTPIVERIAREMGCYK